MIEIKTETFDVKIDDQVYNLSYATVGQFELYMEKTEKDDSVKAQNEAMFALLKECGLPTEVAKSLQNKHLMMIVQELSGAKK